MDAELVWGVVFGAYILSGVVPMAVASNGDRPKGALPGSRMMRDWERAEAKGDKWLKIWGAGFFLLLALWLIFK